MQEHWTASGPPVYMSVAGYLGLIKPNKTKKSSSGGKQKMTGSWDDLLTRASTTGGAIQ